MLREHKIYNYSTGIPPAQQRQLFVEPVSSVEAGLEQALAEHGPDATVAVIPEGPYVMPCLAADRMGRMNVPQMKKESCALYQW